DTVPGRRRRDVTSIPNDDGVNEVLMQVVDVLDDAVLQRSAHAEVVEDREVLNVLAEPHAARVWTDRDTGLRCHQQYAEDLVHTAQPAGVDLTEADRVGLEKLLEDDAVLTVLAGGDPYRRDCPGDGRVAEDVIRAGGLLDPPGVE